MNHPKKIITLFSLDDSDKATILKNRPKASTHRSPVPTTRETVVSDIVIVGDEKKRKTDSDKKKHEVNIVIADSPHRIDKAVIELEPSPFFEDGQEKRPAVTVTLDGKTLTASNYTVTYSDNIKAGTATVTITGKGNYQGTLSRTFTIKEKADLPDETVKVNTVPKEDDTYDGKEQPSSAPPTKRFPKILCAVILSALLVAGTIGIVVAVQKNASVTTVSETSPSQNLTEQQETSVSVSSTVCQQEKFRQGILCGTGILR